MRSVLVVWLSGRSGGRCVERRSDRGELLSQAALT